MTAHCPGSCFISADSARTAVKLGLHRHSLHVIVSVGSSKKMHVVGTYVRVYQAYNLVVTVYIYCFPILLMIINDTPFK